MNQKSSLDIRPFYVVIFWSLVILFVSYFMVGKSLPETLFDLIKMDKVGHFVVYGIYSFLIIRAFWKNDQFGKRAIWIAIIWAGLYGSLMEILQYYVFPNRFLELNDVIANMIGVLASLPIFYLFKNKFAHLDKGIW